MAAGESLSSHAAAAAVKAMKMAGVTAADIDMVLLATSTPDDLFGSACNVRKPLSTSADWMLTTLLTRPSLLLH